MPRNKPLIKEDISFLLVALLNLRKLEFDASDVKSFSQIFKIYLKFAYLVLLFANREKLQLSLPQCSS